MDNVAISVEVLALVGVDGNLLTLTTTVAPKKLESRSTGDDTSPLVMEKCCWIPL